MQNPQWTSFSNKLIPFITVFIMGYECFDKSLNHMHKFVLKEENSNQKLFLKSDLLEMHFIEIPKFECSDKIPK
jgi:uncharacterized alpha/beta hydrolase family protein